MRTHPTGILCTLFVSSFSTFTVTRTGFRMPARISSATSFVCVAENNAFAVMNNGLKILSSLPFFLSLVISPEYYSKPFEIPWKGACECVDYNPSWYPISPICFIEDQHLQFLHIEHFAIIQQLH